jgi:hypothetical protein
MIVQFYRGSIGQLNNQGLTGMVDPGDPDGCCLRQIFIAGLLYGWAADISAACIFYPDP